MKIHRFANLFPMCSDEEIQELADDIKLHGLREPIVTDQDDMILDGRNRFLACEIAGVKPFFAPFVGNEDEKLAYVVSANIHRRHLSTSQKSMVCAKLKAIEKELAADRKKRKAKSVVENLPPQKKGKARDKAGEALGVSGKSVDMAVKVQTDAVPEIISAVESGELAVSAAAVVADMPQDQQRQIVASGGAAAVKDAAANARKKKRSSVPANETVQPHKGVPKERKPALVKEIERMLNSMTDDKKFHPQLKTVATAAVYLLTPEERLNWLIGLISNLHRDDRDHDSIYHEVARMLVALMPLQERWGFYRHQLGIFSKENRHSLVASADELEASLDKNEQEQVLTER